MLFSADIDMDFWHDVYNQRSKCLWWWFTHAMLLFTVIYCHTHSSVIIHCDSLIQSLSTLILCHYPLSFINSMSLSTVILLNLRKWTNIRGWHSKFKRCVETPLAIEVVKDRGGDGDVKDNGDWWKVPEARIIKKTSGQLQRAWCHSHYSCARARAAWADPSSCLA